MANTAFRLIAPVLLGAFILLFPADGLRALGLGEARVDSWLGQRLDVSIRLLAAEDENVESLTVGPAQLSDFERLGVPSEALALGLEVSIDRSVQPPRLRVRSRQPVNDPVVQILIDARWSSGRVLREYTLFLDPPVVESAPPPRRVDSASDAPAPEVARETEPAGDPGRTEPSQRASERAPADERPAAPQRSETPAEAPAARAGGETVDVASGDTLWSIASDWRPDAALSMDQVMLAIFNRNRNAFLGENINRLRSDARLTMPEPAEARAVSRQEAARRVQEHMNAWQPASAAETPVLSEAAMPDTGTAPSASAEAEPQEAAAEETAEAAGREEAPSAEQGAAESDAAEESEASHRLDVRPLDEDQGAEGTAVSDEEVQRVRGRLIDMEDRILAEGLEREEFDDRIAEIRGAINQRDIAGLAVAEESLAELQERLRQVREERQAEQAAESAGDGESASRRAVADYMSRLEGASQASENVAEADETAAGEEQAQADAGRESDDGAETTEAQAGAGQDESRQDRSGDREASDEAGGMPFWLWIVGGGLLLLILAVVVMALRRRGRSEAGEQEAGDDALESARSDLARRPEDLAAHLALLKLLAARGREQEFTDGFDRMYQQVDDESDPHWQEALSLAAAHAPDHPLLTPQETALDDADDDYDRRADEMLGMLETETEDAEPTEDDSLSMLDEDEADFPAAEDRPDADDESEELGDDMDLAVLADRVDDPSLEPGQDRSFDADDGELDFESYDPDDEDRESSAASEAARDEEPVELPDDSPADSELDIDPAREQEADDVFGEAGTREEEDLDLEFSSDVEDDSALSSGDALAFGLDEDEDEKAPEPESPPADQAADEGEADSEASLSDEDADVKLDLARAYISVDLGDSARSVLEEVISDGSESKRAEAKKLLDDLD